MEKLIKETLGIEPLACRMRVNFGSAHIIIDQKEKE